jgi:hypothetical protein
MGGPAAVLIGRRMGLARPHVRETGHNKPDFRDQRLPSRGWWDPATMDGRSQAEVWSTISRKPTKTIPARLPSCTQLIRTWGYPSMPEHDPIEAQRAEGGRTHKCTANAVGQRHQLCGTTLTWPYFADHLKAIWPTTFGSIFCRCSANHNPKTYLERGLVSQCRLHQKSDRQTNSKALPARSQGSGIIPERGVTKSVHLLAQGC